MTAPWEAAGPLRDGDRGPGAPTVNTKKCRWWAPREAVLEVRERPPSPQKILTADPLGGADGESESSHHQRLET
jgi:hypothetical protein